MATNAMGPYFLKLHYVGGTRQHVLNVNVVAQSVGEEGEFWELRQRNGVYEAIDTVLTEFAAVVAPAFNANEGFSNWELLYKSAPEAKPVWKGGGAIIDGEGTSVQLPNHGVRANYSFHTLQGGKLAMVLLETVHLLNQNVLYGDMLGASMDKAFVDYMLGPTCAFVGRDGAYPGGFIRLMTKMSDALLPQIRGM